MQFIGTGDRILTENFVIGYLYTITFKTGIYSNSACIGIGDNFVMFQRAEPDLLFTLNVDTADEVDTIELYDSGGGTNDYDDLVNRPQINSHTLTGNMTGADLGLQDTIPDLDTIRAGAAAGDTAVQPADMTAALAAKQDALSAAQLAAVNSGITSTDVAQITTNENNILSIQTDLGAPIITASTTLADYANALSRGYHTGFFTSGSKPSDAPVSDNCFCDFFMSSANTATMKVYPTGTAYHDKIYYRTKISGEWQSWYQFSGTAVT